MRVCVSVCGCVYKSVCRSLYIFLRWHSSAQLNTHTQTNKSTAHQHCSEQRHTWNSHILYTTNKLLHPLHPPPTNKTQHKVVTQRGTNEEVSTKKISDGVSICPVSVRHLIRQLSQPSISGLYSSFGVVWRGVVCSCVCMHAMHFTVQCVSVCALALCHVRYHTSEDRAE